MPPKREVLEHLKRDELLAALDAFDLSVYDRRQRRLLVDALGRSRRATLEEILTALPRARLKEICHETGLDDGGRAKAVLAARLAGKTAIPEPQETSQPREPAPPRAEPRRPRPAARAEAQAVEAAEAIEDAGRADAGPGSDQHQRWIEKFIWGIGPGLLQRAQETPAISKQRVSDQVGSLETDLRSGVKGVGCWSPQNLIWTHSMAEWRIGNWKLEESE